MPNRERSKREFYSRHSDKTIYHFFTLLCTLLHTGAKQISSIISQFPLGTNLILFSVISKISRTKFQDRQEVDFVDVVVHSFVLNESKQKETDRTPRN